MKKRIVLCMTVVFSIGLSACKTAAVKPIPEPQPDHGIVAEQEEESADVPEEQRESVDLSAYFDGINGCAVFYSPSEHTWKIWNEELAEVASSPCSTFKIVSALFGLETGVIDPEDSVRTWKGTSFWKDDWNQDIGLEDAFAASCIWYFREVIDEIGQDTMQKMLQELNYGNCDISDWEGFQNTNNQYMELRGFWVESSLEISPMDQAEAMYQIFESEGGYNSENIEILKKVMWTESERVERIVYGKTGMGVKEGLCVDAWFTGMFEEDGEAVYFSIRLDDPQNEETSSTKAKAIALDIIEHYF